MRIKSNGSLPYISDRRPAARTVRLTRNESENPRWVFIYYAVAYVIIGVVMWLMVGYEQPTGEKSQTSEPSTVTTSSKRIPPSIEEKTIEMQFFAKASGIAGASMDIGMWFFAASIPPTAIAVNVIKKSTAVNRQTRS